MMAPADFIKTKGRFENNKHSTSVEFSTTEKDWVTKANKRHLLEATQDIDTVLT